MKPYIIHADIQGELILGRYTMLVWAEDLTSAQSEFDVIIESLDESASWSITSTNELVKGENYIFPTEGSQK